MKRAYLNLAIFIILIPAAFYFGLVKVEDINIVIILFFAAALKTFELIVTYLGNKLAKAQSLEQLIFPVMFVSLNIIGIIYGSPVLINFLLAGLVYLVLSMLIDRAKKRD